MYYSAIKYYRTRLYTYAFNIFHIDFIGYHKRKNTYTKTDGLDSALSEPGDVIKNFKLPLDLFCAERAHHIEPATNIFLRTL